MPNCFRKIKVYTEFNEFNLAFHRVRFVAPTLPQSTHLITAQPPPDSKTLPHGWGERLLSALLNLPDRGGPGLRLPPADRDRSRAPDYPTLALDQGQALLISDPGPFRLPPAQVSRVTGRFGSKQKKNSTMTSQARKSVG
jgi:hypothetical protein